MWAHFQNTYPQTFEGAKPRLDFIIKEISRKKRSSLPRVLNIGAGNGYFEESIQRLGWDIYSLDPDEATSSRLIAKGIKGYVGYMQQMPFDDKRLDFVVASEVLEHLSDKQRLTGVKEVVRVLAQDGWFLGTVPYSEDLLLNKAVCPECEAVFHRWGHQKSFDIEAVRDDLIPFFREVMVRKTAFVSFRGRTFAGKVKSLVRLILGKYGATIAFPSIYFAAKK